MVSGQDTLRTEAAVLAQITGPGPSCQKRPAADDQRTKKNRVLRYKTKAPGHLQKLLKIEMKSLHLTTPAGFSYMDLSTHFSR